MSKRIAHRYTLLARNTFCFIPYGKRGEKGNPYVFERIDGDTLHIQSKKSLPARHGVTLQMKFEEGVFTAAPEYPYIIENRDLDIVVDDEQNFIVEQSFRIRSQE